MRNFDAYPVSNTTISQNLFKFSENYDTWCLIAPGVSSIPD